MVVELRLKSREKIHHDILPQIWSQVFRNFYASNDLVVTYHFVPAVLKNAALAVLLHVFMELHSHKKAKPILPAEDIIVFFGEI